MIYIHTHTHTIYIYVKRYDVAFRAPTLMLYTIVADSPRGKAATWASARSPPPPVECVLYI